jgi:hypothetical protein
VNPIEGLIDLNLTGEAVPSKAPAQRRQRR